MEGNLVSGAPTCRQGYVSSCGIKVQYSKEWAKYHPLEGDGLRPLLYMHLWKKNKGSESRLKNIRLPDTVVYEHNFPRAWYTYDGEAKEINKHPGKMLDAQTIFQHFSKTTEGCDVVAQFLTTCTQDNSSGAQEDGLLSYAVFFTADTLREFLFSHDRKPDGILQKFVVPKGNTTMRKNAQLQVMWSPLVAVVYKRINKHHLGDTNIPVHIRSATFEGDYHLSEMSLVADESKGRLESLCREVVDHVYFTDRKLITRMVLTFKVDDANRPWLMWCSSLRVSGDSLNPRNVRIPVALFMRTELMNDGSTTRERIQKRQERQRRLLVMDRQLFELSRDYDFGHCCNATHVREAKHIGLSPQSGRALGDYARSGQPDPLRESTRYFGIPQTTSKTERSGSRHALSPVEQMLQEKREPFQSEFSLERTSADDDMAGRVKSELTAMALDAWYKVYSSTLSEDPSRMPTRDVALTEPLAMVLKPPELERLLAILGLERCPSDDSPQAFRVKHGLLGPGRRFDCPLINAERDVRLFFDDLFALRGAEVTQECLSNDRWVW